MQSDSVYSEDRIDFIVSISFCWLLVIDLVSLARVMGPPDCQGDGTTVARY
ncbi:Uncharacterised protein [Mycolicibacterium gilvum]|uniref:Uncharacterized protein n=1 Tax=Mycolicibacterium gilvum TaxID=1804 RepID=A0A378SJC9_9MYCO|nr:Uncharacterised protein [Mycolicibacterium gilvum]